MYSWKWLPTTILLSIHEDTAMDGGATDDD
jgi:hypothetical protein